MAGYLLLMLSLGMGGIALLGFTVFLLHGPLTLVDLGLNDVMLLAWNLCLSLLFFLQHSVMIRKSFRHWIPFPERYVGVVYALSSSIPLLLLVGLWQQSHTTLLIIQGPLRWALRAIFVFAIGVMLWGVRSLGSFDTFGTEPLIAHMKGRKPKRLSFSVRGPYRWVRHPLYSVVLVLIWSSPDITLDRLWFNLTWTVWIVIGTLLEERDLLERFGDRYREYQEKVPMLMPYKGPAVC